MRVMIDVITSCVSFATLNANFINQLPWLASTHRSKDWAKWTNFWETLESSLNIFLTTLPGKSSYPHFLRRNLRPKERLSQYHNWLVGAQSSIRIQDCLTLFTLPYLLTMIFALAKRATFLGGLGWIGLVERKMKEWEIYFKFWGWKSLQDLKLEGHVIPLPTYIQLRVTIIKTLIPPAPAPKDKSSASASWGSFLLCHFSCQYSI